MIKHKCKIIEGKIIPYDIFRFKSDLTFLNDKDVSIEISKWIKTRSNKQNNSLHLYFQLLSTELNLAGYDMRKVIRPEVDISWTPYSVKEYLWRPLQKVMFGKKSTTQLSTEDINSIYDQVNRIVGERTKIHVPWPCLEELFKE